MNTLEDTLVRSLRDAADRVVPDAGLVDRLLSSVHDDLPARQGWMPPRRRTTTLLMAAAVAVIIVAGVLIGSRFVAQRPSTITPPVTPTPSPTMVSSTGGSLTSTSTPSTSAPSSSALSPSSGANQVPAESSITSRVSSTGAPAGFTLGSISFRSADQGVALGTARCAGTADSADTSRCGMLLNTSDGGMTWSSLDLPADAQVPGTQTCPSTSDTTRCTSTLNFTDPAAGYLWGPRQIYRTTDGGSSWQPLTVGAGTVAQLVSVQGRAFVTTVASPSADPADASLREAGPGRTSLTASTTSRGAEFGSAMLMQGPGIVYRWLNTPQGSQVQASTKGTSWTDLPAPGPRGITAFVAGDGSLVSDVGADDAVAQVLPVGGAAWQRIPRPPAPAGDAGATVYYSVAGAVSARKIAVTVSGFDLNVGGGQAWTSTSDGGRTWDKPMLSTGEAAARGVQSGQVSVAGTLIVPWSLGNAVLRSVDVGQTWTQIDFPRK